MDYQDEQLNEIEALDSIYCGELESIKKFALFYYFFPLETNIKFFFQIFSFGNDALS